MGSLDSLAQWIHKEFPLLGAQARTCLPELGVDLQSLGQHLRSHVSHSVPTDVDFSQGGVASQGIDDDGDLSLEFRVSQGQGLQGLWSKHQATLNRLIKAAVIF